ncbi:MAG TPA: vitamin K epoxide reductase family protein [Verrucomicrobiae bacterium]|nr:vitamin K epoxide reductase family protein [Verrucomicrobiae bacterium]
MSIAALVGLAVSSYLLFEYVSGGPILCGLASHGCDIVRASQWAYIGSIPRPALGVLFYSACLALIVFSLSTEKYRKHTRNGLILLGFIGAIESLYLVGIQAFAIHAYCIWCLTSAGSSFVLLGASLTQPKE